MLNVDDIENTIRELENGDTTFSTCDKLANLYIVRDHIRHATTEDEVVSEYTDILPHYRNYCNVKTDYQLGKGSYDAVVTSVKQVCKEIDEFLLILYRNTDMPEEREHIKATLNNTILHM